MIDATPGLEGTDYRIVVTVRMRIPEMMMTQNPRIAYGILGLDRLDARLIQ
jgi:hypothetical protein